MEPGASRTGRGGDRPRRLPACCDRLGGSRTRGPLRPGRPAVRRSAAIAGHRNRPEARRPCRRPLRAGPGPPHGGAFRSPGVDGGKPHGRLLGSPLTGSGEPGEPLGAPAEARTGVLALAGRRRSGWGPHGGSGTHRVHRHPHPLDPLRRSGGHGGTRPGGDAHRGQSGGRSPLGLLPVGDIGTRTAPPGPFGRGLPGAGPSGSDIGGLYARTPHSPVVAARLAAHPPRTDRSSGGTGAARGTVRTAGGGACGRPLTRSRPSGAHPCARRARHVGRGGSAVAACRRAAPQHPVRHVARTRARGGRSGRGQVRRVGGGES